MARRSLSATLPDFPWNLLQPAKHEASQHPDGLINLSVGSPVDPVAPGIQLALSEAAETAGYPQTIGTAALRTAIGASLQRRYHVAADVPVLPVIGTKEAIGLLPLLLGCTGSVVIPEIAYPTYEVAALTAHTQVIRSDRPWELADPDSIDLVFLNSPSNPTGAILGKEHLRTLITWARKHDVLIASDECYLGLTWEGETYSILHPEICENDYTNLLAIHSLSKTSNLASYRAGFFAGDATIIAELTEIRKHLGLMMPGPIQAAMTAALDDDDQEALQKLRYASRRVLLIQAFQEAGFRIEESQAGLYLWMTRDENCWDTVSWLAKRGILVAPGEFYGEQAANYVRVALTGSDADIAQVPNRLAS